VFSTFMQQEDNGLRLNIAVTILCQKKNIAVNPNPKLN
jgi:hypothetical protein